MIYPHDWKVDYPETHLRDEDDKLGGCSSQKQKGRCHGVVDGHLFLQHKSKDDSQNTQHHHVVDAHADVLRIIQGRDCHLNENIF